MPSSKTPVVTVSDSSESSVNTLLTSSSGDVVPVPKTTVADVGITKTSADGTGSIVPSIFVPVTPSKSSEGGQYSYVYCLILVVFCLFWLRKRFKRSDSDRSTLDVGRMTIGSDVTGAREITTQKLLSGLRLPISLFTILYCVYRILPLVAMGFITYDKLEWLRLIVALSGIYAATEIFIAIFIDYLLIIVQGVDIPRIFYQIIKIFTFVLIGLPVLSTDFGLDITPFLTTSAVLTMVIGLALQDSLGNLFSGIAMQVSNPFKVGDWVLMGGQEGRIREVNWRATTIKTFSNDFLILPNNAISKAEIKNFSRPTKVHARFVPIGLSYSDSPEKAAAMLTESTLSVNGVLPRPGPQIMLKNYNDFTIDYVIKFFILDYSKYPTIESDVRTAIWYALKRASMEIPFPVRTIEYAAKIDKDIEHSTRYDLLVAVDFLQAISDSGLKELVSLLKEEIYPSGHKIVTWGGSGDTFYIIRKGSAEILVPESEDENSEGVQVAVLTRSQYFGEMSLLTGEKRSATVRTLTEVEILSLDKEGFRAILRKEPKLAERISEIIVSRKRALEEAVAKNRGRGKKGRGLHLTGNRTQELERQNLLKKIVHFFGM